MNLDEAIRTRRSVRRFKKKSVPQELVEEIVEAGSFAPSSCNLQTWRVKVFRDDSAFKVAQQKIFLDAPVTLAVYCLDKYPQSEKKIMPFLDSGFFAQNMLLKAHEIGLGACPVAPAFDQEKASRALGLPAGSTLTLLIAIGFPDESPKTPPRLPHCKLLNGDCCENKNDGSKNEGFAAAESKKQTVESKAVYAVKTVIVALALPFLAVKWTLQRKRVKRDTGVDQTVHDKAIVLIKRPWF